MWVTPIPATQTAVNDFSERNQLTSGFVSNALKVESLKPLQNLTSVYVSGATIIEGIIAFRPQPIQNMLSSGVVTLAGNYPEEQGLKALDFVDMTTQTMLNYFDPSIQRGLPAPSETLVIDEQDELVDYMLKNENIEFHPHAKTIRITVKIDKVEHIVPKISIDDDE